MILFKPSSEKTPVATRYPTGIDVIADLSCSQPYNHIYDYEQYDFHGTPFLAESAVVITIILPHYLIFVKGKPTMSFTETRCFNRY